MGTVSPDSNNNQKTAWIFDVDGVLTDPEEKRVIQTDIFKELKKRLVQGNPIAFNTGRSSEFIFEHILEPLEQYVSDKNLLSLCFACAEMGAIQITYKNGEKIIHTDQSISVPDELKDKVRKIVGKPDYSDMVFYDESKKTMISIELKHGKKIEEFIPVQDNLMKVLMSLLQDLHLDVKYKADPTRIDIDIENKSVGKGLGIEHFLFFLRDKKIDVDMFYCFGDSPSDLEMLRELQRRRKKTTFVYVGDKNRLSINTTSLLFTDKPADKGVLEFLHKH